MDVEGVPKGDLFIWSPEERVRNLFVDQVSPNSGLLGPSRKKQGDIADQERAPGPRISPGSRAFHDPQLRKWLHRIDVPTLIVWGDGDKILPEPYGEAYHRLIKGSRLEVLPACGHIPHVEKADAFVGLFTRFADGACIMKFCLFHLMPYAPLDLTFDEKYPSSWMALPNSYYDPKQGHLLYNLYLDQLELCDQLGFRRGCGQ